MSLSPVRPSFQRRIILFVLLTSIAFGAFALLRMEVRPAHALTNCSISDAAVALDSEEAHFLTLINNYRAQNGLAPLKASTNLNRASAWMANDLGANRYFSHTDSSGRSPSQRARDCGYPGGAGENIAAGTNRDTAQKAFDAWRASSGHNQNMLNGSYRMIGIARAHVAGSPYGWYWVTKFGLVDDGTDGTSGGGGGSATATPTAAPTATPTAAPVTERAAITSPAPGSTLPGSSVAFEWNAGSGALEYHLYVGTSPGGYQIYARSQGLDRSVTINNIPTDGSTIHVRLWTRFSSGWQFNDYTFTAATVTTAPPALDEKAVMTNPTPGSTLPGITATFNWTEGNNAREYFLYIGTSPGSNNMFGRSMGLNRSITLTGFPRDGRTLYFRLWTRFDGGWQFNDYVYRAAQ